LFPLSFDRICHAAETFGRVAPLFPAFGITRLARHTGLDRIGIPVWCAYTPNAKSIVVAQGKGLTDADARTSAAMEALERAVACAPSVDRVQSSVAELSRREERHHALPSLIAAGHHPLDPEEVLDWTTGFDLMTGETVHVPWQAVVLDRTIADSRYWQSSDGLASGNTLAEAHFHGLMERVERDAYALWQLRPAETRASSCVEPASFACADLDDLRRRIEGAGLTLRLFDITSDLEIPAFAAFIGPSGDALSGRLRFVDVTYGAGAHPVARRAALRAVTEAAQSRMTYISGARDDVFPDDYEKPLGNSTRQTLAATPVLKTVSPRPVCASEALLAFLAERGSGPMVAVRLSAPDLPFAVVKVLVPHLEQPDGHRRQRFGTRALREALMR
jgi:ribosomal protein S12 methylthiotransferase accessory factor